MSFLLSMTAIEISLNRLNGSSHIGTGLGWTLNWPMPLGKITLLREKERRTNLGQSKAIDTIEQRVIAAQSR